MRLMWVMVGCLFAGSCSEPLHLAGPAPQPDAAVVRTPCSVADPACDPGSNESSPPVDASMPLERSKPATTPEQAEPTCDARPCGPHSVCMDAVMDAAPADCACEEGYELRAQRCEDIDECAVGSDACEQKCINSDGGYQCQCSSGMVLEADRHGCRSPAWGTAALLDDAAAGDTGSFSVAADGQGNALVVWNQKDAAETSSIWSNRYDVDTGTWVGAQLIDTIERGTGSPAVALADDGNGIAIWGGGRLRFSRYRAGIGWGEAQTIGAELPADAQASSFQIGLSAGGEAVAVWIQKTGSDQRVYGARYSANGEWGSPEALDGVDDRDAWGLRLAIDAQGRALAAWVAARVTSSASGNLSGPEQTRVIACTERGWGRLQTFRGINVSDSARDPAVALTPDGEGVLVLIEYDLMDATPGDSVDNRGVSAAVHRYSPAGGVDARSELLETSLEDASEPGVALNERGDGLVVWAQSDGTRQGVLVRRHQSSGAFGAAQMISAAEPSDAHFPAVAVNAKGDGVVVWQQSDDTRASIWVARFSQPDGWSRAQRIESGQAISTSGPKVVMDASGRALAVWQQSDGTRRRLWATRFD